MPDQSSPPSKSSSSNEYLLLSLGQWDADRSKEEIQSTIERFYAWHDRLVQVAADYGPRGVRFLAVNSNDSERYPHDSLEAMRHRVREEEWPFPYLHDESQRAASDWAAQTTPHLYVLDGDLRIRYEGAPDADHLDPKQDAGWLREALDAVLAGEQPARAATEPVGCSIKWKR